MAALISTEDVRIGNVVKKEYWAESGFCRKAVTAYEASEKTYAIGTVLGKTLVSGAAAAVAGASNVGNGTMGSITVSAYAIPGVYTLRIVSESANAGGFQIFNASGALVGSGNVASAFSGAGLAFTLADGSEDFDIGDTFIITVSGTEKWKIVENTASDGSAIARGIYIGTAQGFGSTTVAATTDTTVIILERGPAIVAKEQLAYGASINTTVEKNALYAQLAAVGIIAEAQI